MNTSCRGATPTAAASRPRAAPSAGPTASDMLPSAMSEKAKRIAGSAATVPVSAREPETADMGSPFEEARDVELVVGLDDHRWPRGALRRARAVVTVLERGHLGGLLGGALLRGALRLGLLLTSTGG